MKIKSSLTIEQLPEGGCLILDESAQMSHALRPEAAAVWRCLERGVADPGELARETALPTETVDMALAQIAECGLLEDDASSSRRQLLSRAATVAGAAAALKLVESIATPAPAAAQSREDSATPV
jgi:DNA-binding IclR family transcriptional regulator